MFTVLSWPERASSTCKESCLLQEASLDSSEQCSCFPLRVPTELLQTDLYHRDDWLSQPPSPGWAHPREPCMYLLAPASHSVTSAQEGLDVPRKSDCVEH